jgi:hypothetical protein
VPAVELSLTNASDDVVVRRVVLPHEWSQAPQTLAPRSELALSVRLSLVNPADMRMAGYRAVAFYP